MKLLNFALLNIMLLGGLSIATCNKAHASERPEVKKIKAISTEIREKISFPEPLLNQKIDEKVSVEFRIKEDRTIEVISVVTFNHFLKSYVKKQMEEISLSNYAGFEGRTLELTLFFKN